MLCENQQFDAEGFAAMVRERRRRATSKSVIVGLVTFVVAIAVWWAVANLVALLPSPMSGTVFAVVHIVVFAAMAGVFIMSAKSPPMMWAWLIPLIAFTVWVVGVAVSSGWPSSLVPVLVTFAPPFALWVTLCRLTAVVLSRPQHHRWLRG